MNKKPELWILSIAGAPAFAYYDPEEAKQFILESLKGYTKPGGATLYEGVQWAQQNSEVWTIDSVGWRLTRVEVMDEPPVDQTPV